MKKGLLYILFCIVCISCGGDKKSDIFGGKGNVSESIVLTRLEKNIEKMSNQKWSKLNFVEIREKQIGKNINILKPSEYDAALTLLNDTYAEILVRDADSIMNNCCANEHGKLLADIFNEMKSFSVIYKKENKKDMAGYGVLLDKKQEHDQIITFIDNAPYNYQININGLKTGYDVEYENNTREKAASYQRSTALKCTYIKEGLARIGDRFYFTSRRLNYCKELLKIFLSSDDLRTGDRNILIAQFNSVQDNIKNADTKLNPLKRKIYEFEKMVDFINSKPCESKQNIRFYGEAYDVEYENNCKEKAAEYLAGNEYICAKFKAVLNDVCSDSGYALRRKAYCKDMMDLYYAKGDCSDSTYVILEECLQCYDCIDISEKDMWLDEIRLYRSNLKIQ